MIVPRRMALNLAFACMLCATAKADVLTFDELAPDGVIPNGYGGFFWENFEFLNGVTFDSNPSGYQAGIVSPNNVAFNGNGDPASVSINGGTPFNLLGVYLTASWNDNLNVQIQGFSVAAPIFDVTVTVSATAPTFVPLNFTGVDQVVFNSFGGTQHPGYDGSSAQFALDNFTYSLVPEPASITLAVLGLALLICRPRRRKRI